MIVVTGGAGFIGSNIVKALNDIQRTDILVVDDLTDGTKFANLADLEISDYLDKDDFQLQILAGEHRNIEAIFHLGACSSTTEWNGKYMMKNNFEYSKDLLHHCLEFNIPFLYASSAATYGDTDVFKEERQYEKPLNVYGYSKFLFDQYVRPILASHPSSPVCGFRYFNVYGPRENHKGSMASVAFHLNQQILKGENPKLFAGSENFRRDFIYVEDAAAVNIWCWQNQISGIYNCGTGQAESFEAVANAVIAYHQTGKIETIPFPEQLKSRYQAFTQADLTKLRQAGYTAPFKTVAQGVTKYMQWLNNK